MTIESSFRINLPEKDSSARYSSSLRKILEKHLPENLQTKGLAIVVHHGETDGNLGSNAANGKSKQEPLNEKGKEEIIKIARVLREKIPQKDIKRIRIHVNEEVTRNMETAEIIEHELGIKDSQIVFSDDLRSQDKVYDEHHNLIKSPFFSFLDRPGSSESIPKLRSMAADYVHDEVKKNPGLIHIFVTNRVSYKGFENWADNDLNALHDYNVKTGIMRIVPINSEGDPLNYIDKNLPLDDQENLIKSELCALASSLKLSDLDVFGDNLFDRNNWLWLRFFDFCKIGIEKQYSNILSVIFHQYPNLFIKVLKILLRDSVDEKGKKVLDYLIKKHIQDMDVTKENEEYCVSFLSVLYENNHVNWKSLFSKIFIYNKSLLLDSGILNHVGVAEYFKMLERQEKNNKLYQSEFVSTFLGDVEWDKFFVPVFMEKNDEKVSLDILIRNILDTQETNFFIQGGAGSGKTILSKYLAKELSKTGNTWVKMIDLNDIENFSFEEFTKDIPIDFDGEIILIFDGLDEKDRFKVGQFMRYLENKKSGNVKYVCCSRFFGSDDKLRGKIYYLMDMNGIRSKDIINKYVGNLNSNIRDKFVEKVEAILQKMSYANWSPLIITMIVSIVEDYVCNDEYYEMLDKENIKLSDIYDTFIDLLHKRENNKKNKDSYRTKRENIFMSQRYNQLRIEFLKYLSLFNGFYSQRTGFLSQDFVLNVDGDKGYLNLGDIFCFWLNNVYSLQRQGNREFSHSVLEEFDDNPELLYDFIDSLVNYGFLGFNPKRGYYFLHKSFQNYFGYMSLQDYLDYDEIKQIIIDSFMGDDLGFIIGGEEFGAGKNYSTRISQMQSVLLSFGFNDVKVIIKMLLEIESKISSLKNCDYNVLERFRYFANGVLCECFSGDNKIKYKHIKLVDELSLKPNFLGNMSLMDRLKKEFNNNETIMNKLDNIEEFGEDIISDDYQHNVKSSGFFKRNIKDALLKLDFGTFIWCILFDVDLAYD